MGAPDDVENWNGKTRMITPKTFGPFSVEMPQMSYDDLYKFMVFTLLQHDFSALSTQTIANIGANILTHTPLEFKNMKVGALKLNVACVAWRFWLGALSNKGGRGQRNREEIGAEATTPLLCPARQNRHATQANSALTIQLLAQRTNCHVT